MQLEMQDMKDLKEVVARTVSDLEGERMAKKNLEKDVESLVEK